MGKHTFRQKFKESIEKENSPNYYDVLMEWYSHQHRKVKPYHRKRYSRKKINLMGIRLKNKQREPNWLPF